MRYCPYGDLSGRAHMIVSGTPLEHTSLFVSPFQFTSPSHKVEKLTEHCETSTEIIYALKEAQYLNDVLLASSNIFSVDALTAIFAGTQSSEIIEEKTLKQIAATALYERATDQDITRTVFVLNSWMNPFRSPLNAQMFRLPPSELSNVLFEELLPRLPRIIEKIDYLERYWSDEERRLETTADLIDCNIISLREIDDLDLAIFSIPLKETQENGRLFHATVGWEEILHPMSLHSHTSCSRVLLQSGNCSHFYFRADSLTLCNRGSVPSRKDLSTLATTLNYLEHGEQVWAHDSVQTPRAIIGQKNGEISRLSADQFLQVLMSFLAPN